MSKIPIRKLKRMSKIPSSSGLSYTRVTPTGLKFILSVETRSVGGPDIACGGEGGRQGDAHHPRQREMSAPAPNAGCRARYTTGRRVRGGTTTSTMQLHYPRPNAEVQMRLRPHRPASRAVVGLRGHVRAISGGLRRADFVGLRRRAHSGLRGHLPNA